MILSFNENKAGAGATAPIMGGAGTTTVANIGTTTADLGGTYTSDGGSPITATGFVLYPAGNPSTIIGGSGVTDFPDATLPSPISANATGLTANTNYCFKPYAINAIGTSYGTELCFTTIAPIPTVTIDTSTLSISCVNATGTASNQAGYTITGKGIVVGPSANPVIGGSQVVQLASSAGAGLFTIADGDISSLAYTSITDTTPTSTLYTASYVTYTGLTSGTSYSYNNSDPDISGAIPANTLPTNLYDYWKADTNGSFISVGPNTTALTISGATHNTAGKIANSYSFNGVNNYIYKPGAYLWTNGVSQSVSLWFFANSISSYRFLYYNETPDGTQFRINLINNTDIQGGKERSATGGVPTYTVPGNITLGVRHHIVATYNGTDDNCVLYFNGLQVTAASNPGLGVSSATNGVSIGGQTTLIGANANAYEFDGKIDEIGTRNKVLTPCEVKLLYNRNLALSYN